jgi:Protein SCAI
MSLDLCQNFFYNFYFSYEPEDALEWALVLDEIKGFIKADAAVSVLHADSNPIVLSHRCVE